MKIGIDISQTAYQGTGVAEYTRRLVESLLETDKENTYILFFSSFRKEFSIFNFSRRFSRDPVQANASPGQFSNKSNLQIKKFKFPLTLLDFLWNKLHIFPN